MDAVLEFIAKVCGATLIVTITLVFVAWAYAYLKDCMEG